MTARYLFILLILCCLACNTERGEKADDAELETTADIAFDKTKWRVKEGQNYPFRDLMLNDVVYNDTVRTLDADEIVELLGEPDRINDGHLYYMVSQKRLGPWPLHTKTMVIKLTADRSIEWIKIHE